MKILYRLKQILPVLLCFILLSACVPAQQTNTTTTSDLLENTTATVLGTRSTAVATTTVTTTLKPTTTTLNNTTTTVQPVTTTTTRATLSKIEKTDIDLVFDYESEDYDVLRQVILREFPEEKSLDDFQVVRKGKYDEIRKNGAVFYVCFDRLINGCNTESYYGFQFDANGKLIQLTGQSSVYDPSKVKPPRVPTDAEIEKAKKAEAAKIPENCMVWKQEVVVHYSIFRDDCTFTIYTLFTSKANAEKVSKGDSVPHSVIMGVYTIPR